jgi:acetyl-CoA acetyltransferase
MEGLAGLRTPFRPHGRVTAGNSSGLNDGATASLIASESFAKEFGLPVNMRLVSFAFAGVALAVMASTNDSPSVSAFWYLPNPSIVYNLVPRSVFRVLFPPTQL